jgi:hypothetical protein
MTAAIGFFSAPLQKQCIDCLRQRGSVIYGSSRESRFKAGAAPQLWGAERRPLLQARLPTESMEPIGPSRVREASGACAFTFLSRADLPPLS